MTVLHTTQPAGVPTMNSSEPSVMPKKIPSKKLVCDLNLLLAHFQVQDLCSPCCRHGSWMRHTLKRTLKCGEPICDFHSTGNDLTSKTHTPSQRDVLRVHMTTPCNSRVAVTRVRTFSLTFLMAFSTVPADAESYYGGACATARTPKHHSVTTCQHGWPLSDLSISSG